MEITYIAYIFHDNKFLTTSKFCNTFHLNSSTFLKYFELCSASPQDWIHTIKGPHQSPTLTSERLNTIRWPVDNLFLLNSHSTFNFEKVSNSNGRKEDERS